MKKKITKKVSKKPLKGEIFADPKSRLSLPAVEKPLIIVDTEGIL